MGETCDYVAMKTELVGDLTGGASGDWFSFDLSWLEWPDVSSASLFDWFTDYCGILEGVWTKNLL